MLKIINKPVGITSYDVIRKLKKDYPRQKIGHAGTLDPLASGVLICLIGKDETKNQSIYMDVSKVYEFDVLLGFSTDTYDILGLPILGNTFNSTDDLDKYVSDFKGVIQQKVPPFSAVKIQGMPLYRWYLSGKIDEVEVPIKEINVEEIDVINKRVVKSDVLLSEITETLNKVRKGFRKEDVLDEWNKQLKDMRDKEFTIVTIRAKVSKGTYVRAIAHELGVKLGTGGCITRLVRTKVGDIDISESINIE